MGFEARIVHPAAGEGLVRGSAGKTLRVPVGWTLVPPGNAALTRRIKREGPSWVVQEKKGRRTFSQGVWAAR